MKKLTAFKINVYLKPAILFIAVLLLLTEITNGQQLGQEGYKIVGTGGPNSQSLGTAVAISADGNTAIAGSWSDNNSVGSVIFYTRSGVTWAQQGSKLSGSGAIGLTQQGASVAISADGNTAVVGGYLDNNQMGAAWVYTRTGGVWSQQGSKLVGSDGSSSATQGSAVSISGDGNTILVGGAYDNYGLGATWVFTQSGGVWTQQGNKLIGTGGSLNYALQGQSVSLSYDGNTAIIGGPGDNASIGGAWIFMRTGGNWAQLGTKLVCTDAIGAARQGASVAISGDGNTAIIGGGGDNSNVGAAWIFTKSGNTWSQQGSKFIGSGYLTTLAPPIPVSLSYDGNKALMGGPFDKNFTGCAWLYTRSGGTWSQLGNKILAGDYTIQSEFGNALSLSADGNTAIIGGFLDNMGIGAIWMFSTCTGGTPQAAIVGGDAQTTCSGYKLLATDISSVGKYISSYSWSDGSTAKTSNPITVPGTYSVTITNSCGNTSTTSLVITTINQSPATIISGKGYFCTGSSVTLSASDANITTGPLTYSWSNGSTMAINNPISTIGTYWATITNGIGCTDTAFKVITSNPISILSTGGTGSSGICYQTLKAGFDAINNGTHTGDISILVLGNTTETASCILQASGYGSAFYTSISMKPSGGAARSILGNLIGLPLINLNGASNVSIDGLNTNGNALTFTNSSSSTTTGTGTMLLINDASNNKLINCTILGNSGTTVGSISGGTISISTANTTGNNFNNISYNNIGSSNTVATTMATRHIYIGGTAGKENTGILIDHNNIYNYFRSNNSSAGIDVSTGNTGVSITNNKFYQSATRTFTILNLFHRAISINNASGNGYQVLNNKIGYADSLGAGSYTLAFSNTVSSNASFAPIYLNVGALAASSVQGNTIAGISISGNTVGTGINAPFKGIYVVAGLVTIGNISGNTIGSLSTLNSITYRDGSKTTADDVIGILVSGSNNNVTNNNIISNIAISSGYKCNFYGIMSLTPFTTSWTCNNNTIDNIRYAAIAGTVLIKLAGIYNGGPIGSFTGNSIRNISTTGGNGTGINAGMIGICLNTSANQTLSHNTIYNLFSSSTGITEIDGIYMAGTGTNNIADRNLIYGLSGSSAVGSVLTGMRIDNGTGSYTNNIISIGKEISNPSNIVGIYETNGLNNILHNSLYISGLPTQGDATVYSAGFLSTVTSNMRAIRNNSFYNARSNTYSATSKHYSVSIAGATGLTIDHNLYYATGAGSKLGSFANTDIADLAGWKIATGQDAGSINGNPFFTAPDAAIPDLHINILAGTSITDAAGADLGIVNDFDGLARASLTPTDIGAAAFISNNCVWLGTQNSLWSNVANWACGILPTALSNIIITSSASNMPEVDITSAICNDLNIGVGASLTIAIGNTLNIKGTTYNNGNFSVLGNATFSGNTQTIPAGTYANMGIGGSGTKSLTGAVNITNLLTLNSSLVQLGANDMSISSGGSITGANAAGYIIINGTGSLKQQGIGTDIRTGDIIFPVGTAVSFTPLSINNTGTADEFAVQVIPNVYDAYDNNDLPAGNVIANNYVNKTWTVKETVPGGSNVSLGFQWNSTDELVGFNRFAVNPSHFQNNLWNSGSTSSATGSDPYTIVMSGITSFSPFSVGSTNNALPLTLLSFTRKVTINAVILQWITANEINTAGFNIERSMNGINYVTIGKQEAQKATHTYSFIDNNVVLGATYYYRLKMFDTDGKYTNSVVLSVVYTAKEGAGYLVYPNPVVGSYLNIKLLNNNTDIQLTVVDVNGSTCYTAKLAAVNMSNGNFKIPITQLVTGTYLLKISDKKGSCLQVNKFTVVK